jgi:hypothetical protein
MTAPEWEPSPEGLAQFVKDRKPSYAGLARFVREPSPEDEDDFEEQLTLLEGRYTEGD